MTAFDLLIWGGALLTALGLCAILWCILRVVRARRDRASGKLDEAGADQEAKDFVLTEMRRPLDVDALNAASSELLGLNDFAAFCRRREGATTIRELQRFSWTRDAEGVLVGEVSADDRALAGDEYYVQGAKGVDGGAAILRD